MRIRFLISFMALSLMDQDALKLTDRLIIGPPSAAQYRCSMTQAELDRSWFGTGDVDFKADRVVGLEINLPKGTSHSQVMRCVQEIHDSGPTQKFLIRWSMEAQNITAKVKRQWEIYVGGELDCYMPTVGMKK